MKLSHWRNANKVTETNHSDFVFLKCVGLDTRCHNGIEQGHFWLFDSLAQSLLFCCHLVHLDYPKVTSPSARPHMQRPHTFNKTYDCEKCKKQFISRISQQAHVSSVHGGNNQCSVCNKQFSHRQSLQCKDIKKYSILSMFLLGNIMAIFLKKRKNLYSSGDWKSRKRFVIFLTAGGRSQP